MSEIYDEDYYEEPIPRREVPRPKPAPHERAYWINMTIEKLGRNLNGKPFTFAHINGVTRDWPVQWLQEMYAICNQAENFPRLWFGLIKKRKVDKSS